MQKSNFQKMRGTKSILCLFLLFLGFAAGAQAQQFPFFITYDSLTFPDPDTAAYGDTVRYSFVMHNQSGNAFADSVQIHLRTSQGTFLLADLQAQSVPVGDTLMVSILDTVSQARYGGGVSVVVIWPTSPSLLLADSVRGVVYITSVSIDPGHEADFGLLAFPNPTSGDIAFHQRADALGIEETWLCNVSGQVIDRWAGLPGRVDLDTYPAGTYLLRLRATSGAVATVRVVRR